MFVLPCSGTELKRRVCKANFFFFFLYFSLRSKRFQSSYCAKVRAGAKKKKGGKGRGMGEEETLARKPNDSGKRPLIFHGSVDL